MGMSSAAKDKVLKLLGEPFTAYQSGLDVGWEIDLWGRVRHSIEAKVQLVGSHALPQTSSGKLSRSKAKASYIAGAFTPEAA